MTMGDHLQGASPGAMFWSDVIKLIRDENPEIPITVWCNEDTPLICPLVLAAVSGIEPDTPLDGADRIARTLLTTEGQDSLTQTIGSSITATMLETLTALDQHMSIYADEDTLEEVIDLPDWTNAHVEAMSEAYEEDVERIAQLGNVRLISP